MTREFSRRNWMRLMFALAAAAGQRKSAGASSEEIVTIEPSMELKTSRRRVSLDGVWDFSYDPKNIGQEAGWFRAGAGLHESTLVPGCDQAEDHLSAGMSAQDYEEFHRKNSDAMDFESGLLTELKYPVTSPAWHQKRFRIPAEWNGQETWLHLGGVMPAADLWLNGTRLGKTQTSRCPLRLNVTPWARCGAESTLVVRTYWPQGPRLDGGFEWIGFTGLYRSVWVEKVAPVHIKGIHVVGKINPSSAIVNFTIAGMTRDGHSLRALCEIRGLIDARTFSGEAKLELRAAGENEFSISVKMPGAALWSLETPNLYEATLTIFEEERPLDSAVVRFGLREIRCEGLRVLLNGKPIFLRGGCDVHVYPETLSPPCSKEFYVKRLRQAKKYGFNYTKNCMEIYTPEFLDAADEVGYLVCQEMPFGLMGKYRAEVRHEMPKAYEELYQRELANIVRSDRNHPSVMVYSMVSEFPERALKDVKPRAFQVFSRELPSLAKRLNPNALVLDITGTYYKSWKGDDPLGRRQTDLIEDYVRDQRSQEPFLPLEGYFDDLNHPFLLHEYNCWTGLPELALQARYGKIPYRLSGLPEMEQAAARAGVVDQLPTFVENSRRLKHLLMKSGLERARRNPKISGYHMFLISGYCWCEEGVFNEFYDEPDDMSADEFRTFNGDTVLVLDDDRRRSFECGEQASVGVVVSHFGAERLPQAKLRWHLGHGRTAFCQGSLDLGAIDPGTVTQAHTLLLTMPAGPDPARLDLQVTLLIGERQICRNHWTIWAVPRPRGGDWVRATATDLPFLGRAYPGIKSVDESSLNSHPLIVIARLGPAHLDYLEQGGRIVLLSDGVLKDYRPGAEGRPGDAVREGEYTNLYRSPAYNWGRHGNMGTVIAEHPALGKLPHEGWCDSFFFHLISGAYPLLLEDFHHQRLEPIIRSIGHPSTMVNKAYLFEVGVGQGALLATSLRFGATYDSHPEARYLLDCLLAYAAGDDFAPKVKITAPKLATMLMKRS